MERLFDNFSSKLCVVKQNEQKKMSQIHIGAARKLEKGAIILASCVAENWAKTGVETGLKSGAAHEMEELLGRKAESGAES